MGKKHFFPRPFFLCWLERISVNFCLSCFSPLCLTFSSAWNQKSMDASEFYSPIAGSEILILFSFMSSFRWNFACFHVDIFLQLGFQTSAFKKKKIFHARMSCFLVYFSASTLSKTWFIVIFFEKMQWSMLVPHLERMVCIFLHHNSPSHNSDIFPWSTLLTGTIFNFFGHQVTTDLWRPVGIKGMAWKV